MIPDLQKNQRASLVMWLAAGAMVFVLVLWAITQAIASPSCMTQEEARTKFKTSHLYWHTSERCWDNKAGRHLKGYGKREHPKPTPKPRPQPDGTLKPTPEPPVRGEIIMPQMTTGMAAASLDGMLRPEAVTTWPLLIDIDEDLPECCWPPLDVVDANGAPAEKAITFAERWERWQEKPFQKP
jgi:hypothetical protein